VFVVIFAAVALVLAFAPPRFRKIGFAVVGSVFFVFLAAVLLNRKPLPENPAKPKSGVPAESRKFNFDKYQQEKRDREDPEAKSRIAVSEIRFDQVQAISGVEEGSIQSIHARLYNDSRQFTLTDYSYYLVIQDCLPATKEKSDPQCTTVYDQRDSVSLTVPARQARDVVIVIPQDPISFSLPFKLLGVPRIELKATDSRAYQSKALP
jgi:hypothetical protein